MHDHAGSDCLNCGSDLLGRWCSDCGQRADGNHRSMTELGGELLETLTHADGRLWRTMRRLVVDPAGLTNDYLRGRRVSEIPPLRLFFVMLFLLFTIGSLTQSGLGGPDFNFDPQVHKIAAEKLAGLFLPGWPAATTWLKTHLGHALDHPYDVLTVIREWSERFTVLMLPIAACILWVLFLPKRSATLYDHMVFSIHSLSFCCLVLIGMFLFDQPRLGNVGQILLLLPPVHLFIHMRGVYGGGVVGTFFRMALLCCASSVAFLLLLGGLAGLGLELGANA